MWMWDYLDLAVSMLIAPPQHCAAAASVILCSLQNEVVDTKMKKMLTELMHDSEFPMEEILFLSEDYFLRFVHHPKFNLKYDV
jgi:hypothetical protein